MQLFAGLFCLLDEVTTTCVETAVHTSTFSPSIVLCTRRWCRVISRTTALTTPNCGVRPEGNRAKYKLGGTEVTSIIDLAILSAATGEFLMIVVVLRTE